MTIEDKYLTGILWQDFQHGKLIEQLEKVKQSKDDDSVFNYAIAFLAMYVNDHFALEEVYMKEYKYPETDYHIAAHKTFIKQVKEIRAEFSKNSDEAKDKLINDVSDWIKTHIMDNDVSLGAFISKHEKKK